MGPDDRAPERVWRGVSGQLVRCWPSWRAGMRPKHAVSFPYAKGKL